LGPTAQKFWVYAKRSRDIGIYMIRFGWEIKPIDSNLPRPGLSLKQLPKKRFAAQSPNPLVGKGFIPSPQGSYQLFS
jgi:hypothetical protein